MTMTLHVARRRALTLDRIDRLGLAIVRSDSVPYIRKAARVSEMAHAILHGLDNRDWHSRAHDFFVGGGMVRKLEAVK